MKRDTSDRARGPYEDVRGRWKVEILKGGELHRTRYMPTRESAEAMIDRINNGQMVARVTGKKGATAEDWLSLLWALSKKASTEDDAKVLGAVARAATAARTLLEMIEVGLGKSGDAGNLTSKSSEELMREVQRLTGGKLAVVQGGKDAADGD